MTADALREWTEARELNAKIPALDASVGLALLREKRDFSAALDVFEEGIRNDSENLVNYSGGLAALTLLGKPARARVELLERYPDLQRMPTELVYELALNRAEAGDFVGAKGLFRERFFGREEGGTNVRQVWVEVKLLEATALAKSGKCGPAVTAADNLGAAIEGLLFTQDGLGTWVGAPRTQYFLGEIYSACGKREMAETKFSAASRAGGVSDLVWARAAAKHLNGFDDAAWMRSIERRDCGDASWRTQWEYLGKVCFGDFATGNR